MSNVAVDQKEGNDAPGKRGFWKPDKEIDKTANQEQAERRNGTDKELSEVPPWRLHSEARGLVMHQVLIKVVKGRENPGLIKRDICVSGETCNYYKAYDESRGFL